MRRNSMTCGSSINPPNSACSPMPVAIFGDMKNGLLKSSGRSSSQTFSSFWYIVKRPPSIFFASLITLANGCGLPGGAAAGCGVPGGTPAGGGGAVFTATGFGRAAPVPPALAAPVGALAALAAALALLAAAVAAGWSSDAQPASSTAAASIDRAWTPDVRG